MEKKVIDFINVDVEKYVSLKSIKLFYWSISIILLFMIVPFIVGKVLFSFVFIVAWSLLYWTFVCVLQSKRVNKTFELRFLVNGISGVMTSVLFWGVFTTIQILLSNQPHLKMDHFLWTLLAYIMFSVCMIFLTVLGVRKGIFSKMKRKNLSKKAIAIEGFFAAVLPFSGLIGRYTSKLLRSQVEENIQIIIASACLLLLIFLPGLAHVNFVQYYYCKKYGIASSEDGQTTSPLLEVISKEKRQRKKDQSQNNEKNCIKAKNPISTSKKILKLFLSILIGLVSLFVLLFLVFFVKTIISKM